VRGRTNASFFHGSPQELAPGDLVEPGHAPQWDKTRSGNVYFTDSRKDARAWGRNGHVYEVEPSGEYGFDENFHEGVIGSSRLPGGAVIYPRPLRSGGYPRAYQSAAPLRVVRRVSSLRPDGQLARAAVRVDVSHDDMSEGELRRHMRGRHGFIDIPDDPDWVIDETHRSEHADGNDDHVHPDLEDEYGEDIHLGDQDWMRQVGIEPPRSHW
jgi:hypothetical protein